MNNISPLTSYALAGLRHCWMPEHGRWSHKYHLDGRRPPNQSLPHSDVYYSLNVLLGFAPVRAALLGEPYDVPALLASLCAQATGMPVRRGTWGMALWAAGELGLDAPAHALDGIRQLTADLPAMTSWTAQDVGLSLSGLCTQAAHDPTWLPLAARLRNLLLAQFHGPGALFRDSGRGGRRHFATFATQVYAALALYHYGELTGDEAALSAANACATTLIRLQGPLGEWPWFYLAAKDRILDPYEVYSVHQHGMAPALLHHAVRHGVAGAREAIVKGFNWIFGNNAMRVSMLVPELHLIQRSQARAGLAARREGRLLRAMAVAVFGSDEWPPRPPFLRLTQEMRSYEFGWILWSFGGRIDYPDLTTHREFVAAQEG